MRSDTRGVALTVVVAAVALATGCESIPRAVVAATGTVIGLELSQNPATQVPQMKLGYDRAEVAFVSKEKYAGDDVANVLMELRYGGATGTHPGIYQRLAVGSTAVTQAGAVFMFMREADGSLPDATAIAGALAARKEFGAENFNDKDEE